MKILAIETSCDETAASVISKNPIENHVKILSNVISSSLSLHAKTGGIVPDVAAREQLKLIIPVVKKAIEDSKLKIENLDAIAVTSGPGLIGSLLIGVETAKTLAYLWNKPIIPVNHLLGHIYANFIQTTDDRIQKTDSRKTVNTASVISAQSLIRHPSSVIRLPKFPAFALLVSGGHTDLVLLKNYKTVKWLGGTLDDAAGEAFDKIGRLLNLPYPGGPSIEKVSERGDDSRFTFPRPMIGSKDFNFSFSGLKAAVLREVTSIRHPERSEGSRDSSPKAQNDIDKQIVANISLAVQKSIIEVLVRKTIKAAEQYNAKSILLGGGVACNQKLRDEFQLKIKNLKLEIPLFAPEKWLCTDNAAMIGAYAAFNYKPIPWQKITANPELYFH